jgi:hypothetical protein
MPCYSGFDNIMACKIISLYSDNKKYNAPTIIVYVLLFDADNGKLLSIMVNIFFMLMLLFFLLLPCCCTGRAIVENC